MKIKEKTIIVIMTIVWLLILSMLDLHQWKRFYETVNEWEIKPKWVGGTSSTAPIWVNSDIIIYGVIVIDLGNMSFDDVYVIDEKGDTIFKYTKEK